ncbi:MAG TPA: DNA/RNA non-specific endonuclease [Saprospiraceae bacterium]|nr:DNA/RNA non-specific endonuclease [Saprospiraceae bacterium]
MTTIKDIAFSKASLLACQGFNPAFIDTTTCIPYEKILPSEFRKYLPEVDGNKKGLLHYTNLSVLYHAGRRVPFVSAYNIDGRKKATGVKRPGGFAPDPRIDKDIQLSEDGFYHLRTDITEFEIGHMAANNEMAWGNDAQIKAYQTFHFPNSVPQAENLNTGIWRSLESYIMAEAISLKTNKRICVFTGPLLAKDDPAYVLAPSFNIPLLFYKVIVFPTPQGLKSTAFVMSHEQRMIEHGMFLTPRRLVMIESGEGVGVSPFADFKYRKVFQVNIGYLEDLTGLHFTWRGIKAIKVSQDKNQVMKIRKIKNAADAKAASKVLRRGEAPPSLLSDEDLTPAELRKKSYRLNIALE